MFKARECTETDPDSCVSSTNVTMSCESQPCPGKKMIGNLYSFVIRAGTSLKRGRARITKHFLSTFLVEETGLLVGNRLLAEL